MVIEASHFYSSQSKHGEGPVWLDGAIWWVDIESCSLNRCEMATKQTRSFPLPFRPGVAVPCEDGKWMVGDEVGLISLDVESGKVDRVKTFLSDERLRMNDGKCDPLGRFWFGTMNEDLVEGTAGLYSYSSDDVFSLRLENLTVSNGLAWSKDSDLFYFIDTPKSRVDVFNYDISSGALSNGRVLLEIPVEAGYPDGMCIDSEGHLWIALWGGSAVQRYNSQTGEVIARVELPVSQPSSCCFGGENLDKLFITTSPMGLSNEALEKEVMAGDLFVVSPGVSGVATQKYWT